MFSIAYEVDFYRLSVALFANGVALLSGIFPVLVKESENRSHFPALLLFAGSYYFTLAYLRNFRSHRSDIETVCVVLGCLGAMMCKMLMPPKDTIIVVASPNDDEEYPEIELMLPDQSEKQDEANKVPNEELGTRVVKRNFENCTNIALCFFAAFLFNVGDGIDFASKEHEGYGKLIATVANAALISTSQGCFSMRNSSVFSYYGTWITLLSVSYPIGILIGVYSPTMLDGLFARIVIALSRGILLFSSLVCLIGSQLRPDKIIVGVAQTAGLVVGSSLAIISCVYF